MQEKHDGKKLDDEACEKVSRWLTKRSLVDGLYAVSPDRPFAHDEEAYDEQYALAADDLRLGSGLMNLLRQRGADMSSPCLEIGCGTGALTLGLAAAEEYPFVVATDMSSSFLRIVQRKAQNLGVTPDRLRLALYDSDSPETIPPPAVAFSLIALRAVLHHVLEPEAFIRDMAALLKPGGFLVMHEPCREGMMMLGLLARIYGLSLLRASMRNGSIADTEDWQAKRAAALNVERAMMSYSRRDIDKSSMEDKHLFLPEEVTRWAQNAGLDAEFLPNQEFFQFHDADKEPGEFSVRHYISAYLHYCMGLDKKVEAEFSRAVAPYALYMDQCSQGGPAPAFHGIFLLRKRT